MDTILINVQEMLEQHNPHVQTFQTAANRLRETPNINLNIRISGDQRRGRQYAAPTANDTAHIIENPQVKKLWIPKNPG